MTLQPPPAEGVRLEWLAVPERVRAALERWAGSAVKSAISQRSGFSPGVAARLRLADGRRLFVKAIGPEPNPDSPRMHRREARIVAALPENVPVPRLRWFLDEDWVVLAFELVLERGGLDESPFANELREGAQRKPRVTHRAIGAHDIRDV